MLAKIILIFVFTLISFSSFAAETIDTLTDLGADTAQFTRDQIKEVTQQISAIESIAEPIEAFENPSNEVELSKLTIIGRGFQDKKTGNTIALACFGISSLVPASAECSRFRHVFINYTSGKAFFTGKVYTYGNTSFYSERENQKMIARIGKSFKKYKRGMNQGKNILHYTEFGMAGILVVSQTGLPAWVFVAGGSLAAAGGVAVLGTVLAYCLFAEVYDRNGVLFAHAGGTSHVLRDQNGWNWSIQPKTVSHSTFEFYQKWVGVSNEEASSLL